MKFSADRSNTTRVAMLGSKSISQPQNHQPAVQGRKETSSNEREGQFFSILKKEEAQLRKDSLIYHKKLLAKYEAVGTHVPWEVRTLNKEEQSPVKKQRGFSNQKI